MRFRGHYHNGYDVSWYNDSGVECDVRVFTGEPGATVELVPQEDGMVEERNGNGTVVAVRYPPHLAKEMGL